MESGVPSRLMWDGVRRFCAGLLMMPLVASGQDTVRVRADGPPRWGEVRLVQELAIGQVDGPTEYAFGSIYFAAPAADSSFFLFDGNDGQIRRYDDRGVFTGLIGRRGGGPGEYQSVGGMAVDATGSLVVFDPGNRRVTHFAPDGKVVREWRTTRSAWNDFFLDSAGRFYFRTPLAGGPFEGAGARVQYVRHSADTRVPFIRDLRSDHQGRIWVEVYVQAERRTNLPATRRNGGKMVLYWRERTTYDVFSPAGQYLGRVALPQDTRLLAIHGDRLHTIARGAQDEERLIVYRIQPSLP